MQAVLPNIFEFADYRKYLDAVFHALKKHDPRFSYRTFAKMAKSTSSNFLQLILAGKLNLNNSYTMWLAKSLKLKKKESVYLEAMVMFDQAKTLEGKDARYRRLLNLKKKALATIVDSTQYEYYTKWYYSAVRAVVGFYRFKKGQTDFGMLARQLSPSISARQAQKALELLEELGLIEVDKQGYYRQSKPVITSGDETRSMQISTFQRETLRLALDALENCPGRSRDISTLTLNISAKGFRQIKDKIRTFRNELIGLAKNDPKDDRVYQVNLQFFPLSKVD